MTLRTNGEIALQLELTGSHSLQTLACAGKAWNVFAPEVEIRNDCRNRIYLLSQAECTSLKNHTFRCTWPDADFTLEERYQVAHSINGAMELKLETAQNPLRLTISNHTVFSVISFK